MRDAVEATSWRTKQYIKLNILKGLMIKVICQRDNEINRKKNSDRSQVRWS